MAEAMGVSLKNRTTKKPHRRGRLWAVGEAGGGLPGNLPDKTLRAGTGEPLVASGAAEGG